MIIEFNDEKTLRNLAKDKEYWSNDSFDVRWKYMSFVIDTIKNLNIDNNILEIGTNGLPLCKTSTQLEINLENFNNRFGIIHNLNEFPYPFDNKQFDLSIALQVWEHLDNKQKSFNELKRISKNIILSFPYKWTNKFDKIHYNIDEETISAWTNNQPYTLNKIITSKNTGCGKRIVYLWENLN